MAPPPRIRACMAGQAAVIQSQALVAWSPAAQEVSYRRTSILQVSVSCPTAMSLVSDQAYNIVQTTLKGPGIAIARTFGNLHKRKTDALSDTDLIGCPVPASPALRVWRTKEAASGSGCSGVPAHLPAFSHSGCSFRCRKARVRIQCCGDHSNP